LALNGALLLLLLLLFEKYRNSRERKMEERERGGADIALLPLMRIVE
jgi:hypothetical protein